MDSLQGAVWIDVNSLIGMNALPDRIPDATAVKVSGLFNLFNCPIGGRSRTFEPLYGSFWYQFLQEPISDSTAESMRMCMVQAIATWEPRIQLDQANTFIKPDLNIPGYVVRIAFRMLQGSDTSPQSIQFHLAVV